MSSVTWEELLILLDHAPDFAAKILRKPCVLDVPAPQLFETLERAAESAGLLTLLRRHIISCIVSNGSHDEQIINTCLQDCSPLEKEHILKSRWIAFPVVTCRAHLCSKTWLLAGTMTDHDSTGTSLLATSDFSEHTKSTMRKALSAAKAHTRVSNAAQLIVLPLTNGQADVITGGSLGLALVLALMLCDEGRPWPCGLVATGGIDSSGRIFPVDLMDIKQEFAAVTGETLICPASDIALTNRGPANLLLCSTLSQAAQAVMFASEGADTVLLPLLLACMCEPAIFLQHFHEIPVSILRSGRFQSVCNQISTQPERYIDELSECLYMCANDTEYAKVIAGLFTPDQMVQVVRLLPAKARSALRAVTARIAVLGHTGDTAALSPWIRVAQELGSYAGQTATAQYYNHCFTALRHNRFDFRPDLPHDFASALITEQRVMAIRKEDNWLLGAMHGTVAQNYGFCGPQFLPKVKEHVKKGIEAFGVRYADEALRLKNYLVYALLDAGKTGQAACELAEYLQPNPDNQGLLSLLHMTVTGMLGIGKADINAPYRLLLILRFMADTGKKADKNIIKQISFLVSQYRGHPWQLIALNAARLSLAAKWLPDACKLLEESVEICMAGSTTMNVMALLPLSLMYVYQIDPGKAKSMAIPVKDIISDQNLVETGHFQRLIRAADMGELLAAVANRPEKWFPFSYR